MARTPKATDPKDQPNKPGPDAPIPPAAPKPPTAPAKKAVAFVVPAGFKRGRTMLVGEGNAKVLVMSIFQKDAGDYQIVVNDETGEYGIAKKFRMPTVWLNAEDMCLLSQLPASGLEVLKVTSKEADELKYSEREKVSAVKRGLLTDEKVASAIAARKKAAGK